MNRTEKEQNVEMLREKMTRAKFVAAVAFEKLDANTTVELRRAMRAAKIDYKVVKNSLALRAAKGTSVEKLAAHFDGPVAVAMGYGDIVADAKSVTDAFKKASEKVRIKGAVADGEVHDAAGVEALSKLPGFPELRATLLALVNTPATMLVRLVKTPGEQIARVLQANVDKEGGEKEAA